MTAPEPAAPEVPQPWHRWAINEDPGAPSRYTTSTGRPDHCLTCGVVRAPLADWAQQLAAGPCPGPQPHHRVGDHLTALEERPVRGGAWVKLGRCSCGWSGPVRAERVAAEADAAGHLLEVQS